MKTDVIVARFELEYSDFQLDVDLALPASGVSVIFGESGSGKTSLLRCMAGLERPSRGFFSFNDNLWQDSNEKLFLPTHQRNLGYVFQEANLFPHINVLKNLQYGLNRIADKQLINNVDQIIKLLGINHLLNRMPMQLSGGERQRVAIGRALVLNPDLLLMDEPLASLDLKRKQEVMPYLLNIQQEFDMPIIYVTHSYQEVMQLADYLVILDKGKVQAAEPLKDMLGRLDLTLAQDKEAASVWQGRVKSHDHDFQLSIVDFNGITLSVPMINAPIGTRLRILLHARDVSLTLQAPVQTSILNVLCATIIAIDDNCSIHTGISLQCGGEVLLAHITRKSTQLLGLQPGMRVFAQIKGTSLLM